MINLTNGTLVVSVELNEGGRNCEKEVLAVYLTSYNERSKFYGVVSLHEVMEKVYYWRNDLNHRDIREIKFTMIG